MRWLEHIGEKNVIRLNTSAPIERIHMDDDSFELVFSDQTILSKDLKSIWFRRGNAWFDGLLQKVTLTGRPSLAQGISDIYVEEARRTREYFHFLLTRNVRSLGHPAKYDLNKPIVLALARDAGLRTPRFSILNTKQQLQKCMAWGQTITKPVSNGLYLWDFKCEQTAYFSYTERVHENSFEQLPERFPMSFVQEEIEKDFEVRTFFLDGEVYSMAILSQEDATTSVDFRKYNWENPNRMVPFEIPPCVVESSRTLFKSIGLNTGSLDFIVGKDGDFYFLEINPIGQYEWVSRICNYQLDRKIAHWLAG